MIQSPFIYLGRNVMSTDSTFYSLVLLTNVVTLFLRQGDFLPSLCPCEFLKIKNYKA